MPYNSMSHVGLENDLVPPHMLKAMSTTYHYGWAWNGPEPENGALLAANGAFLCSTMCLCDRAECGLVTRIEVECSIHRDEQLGRAKQIHKASECPGASNARLPAP